MADESTALTNVTQAQSVIGKSSLSDDEMIKSYLRALRETASPQAAEENRFACYRGDMDEFRADVISREPRQTEQNTPTTGEICKTLRDRAAYDGRLYAPYESILESRPDFKAALQKFIDNNPSLPEDFTPQQLLVDTITTRAARGKSDVSHNNLPVVQLVESVLIDAGYIQGYEAATTGSHLGSEFSEETLRMVSEDDLKVIGEACQVNDGNVPPNTCALPGFANGHEHGTRRTASRER
jgi:hypothetical protein